MKGCQSANLRCTCVTAMALVEDLKNTAATNCMLFTIYLFIIMVDINALEQQCFRSTVAKLHKKNRCYIENVIKWNHKGR